MPTEDRQDILDKETQSLVTGLSEVGSTGLKRMGGQVFEEFLPALSGVRAIRTYKEMAENDATIGAILFAIEQILRQVTWTVEPVSQGKNHLLDAEFLESCLDDMSMTWGDTISEILSMLVFGWSYHEIVYKLRQGPDQSDPSKRSKYKDGLIGWRKIPIRAQETFVEWVFDETGGVRGMKQSAPPTYQEVVIPIEKALLFRTTTKKNNPEGHSVLRNAYRSWYYKKRIEEIEGIGIERDLAGMPVIQPPEGLDLWDDKNPDMVRLRRQTERLVRNIRRDQNEGVVMPFGWTLTLLSTGGRRQVDVGSVIERYDRRIAMTVLADFILLGHEKVGSFALADNKTDLFAVALAAWLDEIEDVFNRYAIPRLFQLNPSLGKDGEYPRLKHGDIEQRDLTEISAFLKEMVGIGLITPDPELEKYLRQAAKLPGLPDDIPSASDPKVAAEKEQAQQQATLDQINAKARALAEAKGLMGEKGTTLKDKAKQAMGAIKDKLPGKGKTKVTEPIEDDEEE